MRISDWRSDVCSSDLMIAHPPWKQSAGQRSRMPAPPPPRPAMPPAGSGRPGDSDSAWHRRVWQLAGPIILANLTTPLLGAVDTAVVGHLPDPRFIGGVAVGGVVFSFLFWGFCFLRMGTAGFDRKSVVLGRGVAGRCYIGGRRN